jgi:hypothetical protein
MRDTADGVLVNRFDDAHSQWPVSERALVGAFAIAGIAERAAWNALRPTTGAAGEATKVALAIAQGRGFADAYQSGQGPTAHLLPISPGLAGLVYSALGPKTLPAEIMLASYSIALAIGTYLILYRVFAKLGVPAWARLTALGFGCLVPTYISQEAVDFRTWEGGLAAFIMAIFLLIVIEAEAGLRKFTLPLAACLASLLFFINPLCGVAAFGCALLFSCRKLSRVQTLHAMIFSAATLAILIGPWTWRNYEKLHAPIYLRSDSGLELALADYPGALDGNDRRQHFLTRIDTIHPSMSHAAYDRMRSTGGEVAYARQIGGETRAWLTANPRIMAQLLTLHMRQMLVPQRWQFNVYGTTLSPSLRATMADLIGILGFLGIVWALARRQSLWLYPALLVIVPVLLVAPFQPVPRYTYLIYPTLIFCAAGALASLSSAARKRRTVAVAG